MSARPWTKAWSASGLLADAVADLDAADLGQRVAQHGEDGLGRGGVGRREAVAIVERLDRDDLAVAHRVGGRVGIEQPGARLEHLAHDPGLVAQTGQLERELLQRLQLGASRSGARRSRAASRTDVGVVEGEGGELADRSDELDLLGRVRARLAVVEELDRPITRSRAFERHAELGWSCRCAAAGGASCG